MGKHYLKHKNSIFEFDEPADFEISSDMQGGYFVNALTRKQILSTASLGYYSPEKMNALREATSMLDDGWQFADDWTKDNLRGAVYMKQIGGAGTPYVTYDFTICKSDDGQWIPVHGSVKMAPVESPVAAARALESYWNELPDRHKLQWNMSLERQAG